MSPAAGEGPAPPACSIVIGVRAREHDARRCLQSLEPQVAPDVEVIVVADHALRAPPGWTRAVNAGPGSMAELWAAGLAQARGGVIGLLSAGVAADPQWVARARAMVGDRDGTAASGGPIEPGPEMGLVDWAVYFCRYAPYLRPLVAPGALEVPADNAVYRAVVLDRYRWIWQEAFWEPFVHRAMRADGHSFTFDVGRVVRYTGGMGVGAFVSQRYRHGRAYGELRSAEASRGAILRTALSAPAVPLVMTARAARQVYGKRRHRGRFVAALPLVLLFYSSWAIGELVGRLTAAVRPPAKDRTGLVQTRP